MLRENQRAAEFSLQDLEGKRHHLSDYRGKWLLLMFHRHLG